MISRILGRDEPETVRIACRESLRQILFRRGVINIGALVEFAGTRLRARQGAVARRADGSRHFPARSINSKRCLEAK